MPKFFCDYCDVYLTHDSMSVRKAHNSGRNHLRNVVEYYQQIGHEKAQAVIDGITSSYAAEGQTMPQPPGLTAPGSGPPGFPPANGMPPFPPIGSAPGQMPPGMPPMPPGFPPMPPGGRGMPPLPPGFPPLPNGFPPGFNPSNTPGFSPAPPGQGSPAANMPFPPPGAFPPGFPPGGPSPAPGQQGQGMSPPPGVRPAGPPSAPPGVRQDGR